MKIDEIIILAEKYEEHAVVRPQVLYKNYDYGQQTKSEKEKTKVGPGTGFFSNMNNFKSVKDFINSDRKMKRKQRKKKLAFIITAKDLSDIPKDVLNDGYEENEEISQDGTIAGIPFMNRVDQYPAYDASFATPVGYMFDNDVTRNSYEGIYSLQGSAIEKLTKLADVYYDLVKNK